MDEDYTQIPQNIAAAKAEIKRLQAQRKKARSVYWATISLIGMIFFFCMAFGLKHEKKTWSFVVSVVFFVLFFLAAFGKITWAPSRRDEFYTKENETDRRIAFLEGYIRSEEKSK